MSPAVDVGVVTEWLAAIPPAAVATVLAFLVAQRVVRCLGLWAYAAFALPGTLAHELAHYVVAWLLAARPRLPDLRPQRTATGWRLGAVAFVGPWWRAGPIALAPVLLLPASIEWVRRLVAPADGMAFFVHAWIAATLLSASLPSRTDLRIALPTLAVIAALLGGAAALVALR